jgi:hypothetical protein
MPNLTIEPPPFKNPLTTSPTNPTMAGPWMDWIQIALLPRVENAAPSLVTAELTAQAASIGTTVLIPTASGVYRVNWYARITQAATTSSSLLLTMAGTDGTVPVAQSTAAITGNTAATAASGMFLVQCDASSPLTYATTYASVGGTAMQYLLTIIVEGLL